MIPPNLVARATSNSPQSKGDGDPPEGEVVTTSIRRRGIEKWVPWAQVIGPIITVAAVFVAYLTLQVQMRSQQRQMDYFGKTLKRSVLADMSGWTFKLDEVFFQNPELTPYFEKNVDILPDNPLYGKALQTAELTIDIMDSMIEMDGVKPDGGWDHWIKDTFANSPILRRHLRERWTWYDNLYPKFEEWEKTQEKQPGAPPD
jgi:hypothetical protein